MKESQFHTQRVYREKPTQKEEISFVLSNCSWDSSKKGFLKIVSEDCFLMFLKTKASLETWNSLNMLIFLKLLLILNFLHVLYNNF